MASNAVNAKSFANYIVSLCTYCDGTALSSANKTQLYNYLIEDFTNVNIAINIKTALAIINKLMYYMTGTNQTISISNGNMGSLLSINSAKQLVDKAFPSSSGYRAKFITLNKWHSTTTINAYNSINWTLYMPAASSFGSPLLSGTLYGGGGGGSGAVTGDGDKNASFTLNSGKGASGGTSKLTHGSYTKEATGGAGGASVTTGKVGGNPQVKKEGNQGSAGNTQSISVNIARKTALTISIGYGGGGGGGCSADAGGTTGTKTFTASSGSGKNGGNGLSAANEWSSDDDTFGGGGGGGGLSGTGGTSGYAGPKRTNQVSSTYNGTSASGGKGGKGGYTNKIDQSEQSSTIGASGLAGTYSFTADVSAVANGGNGGNCGGLVVDSTCAAANALLIFR